MLSRAKSIDLNLKCSFSKSNQVLLLLLFRIERVYFFAGESCVAGVFESIAREFSYKVKSY